MTTKAKTTKTTAKKPSGVPNECRLKNDEMETHISFDLVDRTWKAWTTIKKDIAKLKRQGWTLVKTEYYADGSVYSSSFEAPENALTFRSIKGAKPVVEKSSTRKPMSDEQKEKMRLGRLAKKAAEAENAK